MASIASRSPMASAVRFLLGLCALVPSARAAECQGSVCWGSGGWDSWDCDGDSDCLGLSVSDPATNAPRCGNANCPWDGDWLTGKDDCCQKSPFPLFTFDAYETSFAPPEAQDLCAEHPVCGPLCSALEAAPGGKLCEVRSPDGSRITCVLGSNDVEAQLPMIDLSGGINKGSFEFRVEVDIQLDLCSEEKSFNVVATAVETQYFWDGTAPVCEGDCRNPGGDLLTNRDVDAEFGDGPEWAWTGKVSSNGGGAECLTGWKLECGRERELMRKEIGKGHNGEIVLFDCNDFLKNACQKLVAKAGSAGALASLAMNGFKVVARFDWQDGDPSKFQVFFDVRITGHLNEDGISAIPGGELQLVDFPVPVPTTCDTPGDQQHCTFQREELASKASSSFCVGTYLVLLATMLCVFK